MGFLAATDSFQNKDINNTFQANQAATQTSNYGGAIGAAQGQQAAGNQTTAAGVQGMQGVGAQQQSFANSLQQQAAGQGGPTMADTELTTATNQNNANAAGLAASSKGLNPAMAARTAMNAAAGNNQTAANQAAQTKVQEQLNAQGQLGGALSGASATQANIAGAGNAQNQGGTGALSAAAGAQNSQNANAISNNQGTNQLNENAALANQQGQLQVQQGNAAIAAANTQAQNAMTGGLMNAVGGAAAMFSDGGEVPSLAMAKGGTVPGRVGMPHQPSGMAAPHRSFAAQVAHHLSREFFAEGGDVPATEADKRQADAENASASTSDLETSSLAAAPKGEKNVQGVDLSEKGQAKPMRANIPIPKKYAAGGEVDYEAGDDGEDNEEEPDEAVFLADGGDADQAPSPVEADPANQFHPKPGQLGSRGVPGMAVGLYNLGQKLFGSKHVTQAAMAGDQAAQAAAAKDPAAIAAMSGTDPGAVAANGAQMQQPPGTAHPELKDAAPQANIGVPDQTVVPAPTDASAPVEQDMARGGPVPGKAKVPGNSKQNDQVPAMLSPGEVVLPRTISHDPEQAKSFVKHLAKNGGSGPKSLKDMKKRPAANAR